MATLFTRPVGATHFSPSIEYEFVTPQEKFDNFMRDFEYTKQQRILEAERVQREAEEAERLRLIAEEEERLRQPHFNPYNITELSNLTKEQMYRMLEGTALVTLVDAYYWYEQAYGINAIFLMSLNAEESGWGRSELAITRNNLSGHKDYYTGDWKYYSDWGQCVEESFRLISEEYVSPDGDYYCGPSIYDINLTYCPDPVDPNSWANNITNIGYRLLSKL